MKTRKQIDDAIAALILNAACLRNAAADAQDDGDKKSSRILLGVCEESLMAAGALAWAIDEPNPCEGREIRKAFDAHLAEIVHDFDQAAARAREERADGCP